MTTQAVVVCVPVAAMPSKITMGDLKNICICSSTEGVKFCAGRFHYFSTWIDRWSMIGCDLDYISNIIGAFKFRDGNTLALNIAPRPGARSNKSVASRLVKALPTVYGGRLANNILAAIEVGGVVNRNAVVVCEIFGVSSESDALLAHFLKSGRRAEKSSVSALSRPFALG